MSRTKEGREVFEKYRRAKRIKRVRGMLPMIGFPIMIPLAVLALAYCIYGLAKLIGLFFPEMLA